MSMQTLTRYGANTLKKYIDSYWASTRYGKYLVTWVEQDGDSKLAPWVVRSNMINGFPPTPEVLAIYNAQLEAKRLRWP